MNRLCVILLALLVVANSRDAVGQSSAKKPAQVARTVGCWYSPFYFNAAFWPMAKRDTLKIPVAGWGSDTLVGTYSQENDAVLLRQLLAMKKAGIDLVIIDMTNGYGNPREIRLAKSMFRILDSLSQKDRLKAAIAIGKEFWGPQTYSWYKWKWTDWDTQYSQQRTALRAILRDFAKKYPSVYFKLEGKPLVVAYLSGLVEAPQPYGMTKKKKTMFKHTGITLRNALSWTATFSDSSRGDAGQEIEDMWGWGARYPQPAHKKEMMVFPGTYNWPVGGGSYSIDREGGRFYIRSWERIIEKMPKMAIITDWNNWNEETAIEGCVGPHGWKDFLGNPTYDWYLKITADYASIFHGHLPKDAYMEEKGSDTVYVWNGKSLRRTAQQMPVAGEPMITLPAGFFSAHGYLPK